MYKNSFDSLLSVSGKFFMSLFVVGVSVLGMKFPAEIMFFTA